jgi:hypothetical protein
MYFCLKCHESHNEINIPGNILTTAFVSKNGDNVHAGYCEIVTNLNELNNTSTNLKATAMQAPQLSLVPNKTSRSIKLFHSTCTSYDLTINS